MGKVMRVATAVLLLLMVSCGGGGGSSQSVLMGDSLPAIGYTDLPPTPVETEFTFEPYQGEPQPPGYPAFPGSGYEGEYSGHTVSAEGSIEVDTLTPTEQQGEGNHVEPDGLVVSPGGDDELMAWARYSIPDLTTNRPVDVTMGVVAPGGDDNLPLNYFVGVANFTNYSWEWFYDKTDPDNPEPFTNGTELTINSEDIFDRFVSDSGDMHIVLVCAADENLATPENPQGLTGAKFQTSVIATLGAMDAGYENTRPHFAAIDSMVLGSAAKSVSVLDPTQYVTINWTHIYDASNPSLEAIQYFLYRKGPEDTSEFPIGSKNSPTQNFTDPDPLYPDVPEVIPGATYTYYLRAFNSAGWTPFNAQNVAIPLLPPVDVAASYNEFPDKIQLTWQAAEGASEYEIYRDDPTGFSLHTITDAEADANDPLDPDLRVWDDTGVPNYTDHMYWIKSVNDYATSDTSSPAAVGSVSGYPHIVLVVGEGEEAGTAEHTVNFDASGSYDPDNGQNPGDGIVLYEWDFDGDGTYEETGNTTGLTQHTYTVGGSYDATVKVWDDENDFDTGFITIAVNIPPVADLTADPTYGPFPLTVTFDATGSTDSDGTVDGFEWDFDGNGAFNEVGLELAAFGLPVPAPYTYATEGLYTPGVRVTDNDGGTNIATVTVGGINDEAICYVGSGTDSIWVMNSDGTGPDQVCTAVDANSTAWSPDKSRIAFTSKVGGLRELYVVEVTSGTSTQVTSDGNETGEFYWDNNDYIVYTKYSSGTSEIYRIKIDGTEQELMTSSGDSWADHGSVISPDGKKVVFGRYATGDSSSNKLYIAGYPSFGNPIELTDLPSLVEYPTSWSSGDEIIFGTGGANPDIFRVDVDGTDQQQITPEDGYHYHTGRFRTDGSVLVIDRWSDSSNHEAYTINRDGSDLTDITTGSFAAYPDWYTTRWPKAYLTSDVTTGPFPLTVNFDASASYDMDNGTGDGLGIVQYDWDWDGDGTYDSLDGSATPQYTYSTEGNYTCIVRVTDDEGDQNTWEVNIYGGGGEICFGNKVGGNWGIYTMNSDGTDQTEILALPAQPRGVAWSPDKTKIAFHSLETSPDELWVVNADGSGKTQLTSFGNYAMLAYWEDNEYIVFQVGNDPPQDPRIARIKSDGTGFEYLTDAGGDYERNGKLSPDGKRITYSRGPSGDTDSHIYVADYPTFNNASLLVDTGAGDVQPCWSVLDIIVWVKPTSDYLLFSINPDGTDQQQISQNGSIHREPIFSDDGTELVFNGHNGGNVFDLYKMNTDGTNLTALTNTDNAWVCAPDWYRTRWPKAALEVTGGDSGDFPRTIDFDASASYDMDNGTGDGLGIVQYDWDWEGDGTYDVINGNSTEQHTYTTQGYYTCVVRVTDDEGDTNTWEIGIGDQRGDWHMFGREATHNRRSPNVGPATNAVDWSYATGGDVFSSAAIAADGTVYVGSWDNKLHAINPDGSPKGGNWPFDVGGRIESSPAIDVEGTIYVGCADSKLYAINPDGTSKSGNWPATLGGLIAWSSPSIASDGTVYIGCEDNKLYAMNPDGSEKWAYPTGGAIISSPAIGSDGTVYVGSRDDHLHAINPDGSFKWSYLGTGDVNSSPAIGADGTVYVGSSNMLYAISSNGGFQWSFPTGEAIYSSSPAIGHEGRIFVGSRDDKLYALNTDGTMYWSYTAGGDVLSSPAVGADGTVYVGSHDNRLYAINPDGTLRWSYSTGGIVYSSPVIGADGTVYVGSYDNSLYAFGPGNGPVADLDATPVDGTFPLAVDFDASASFDVDGTIDDYEWDFDGNGVFNEAGDEATAQGNSTPSKTYTTWGVYRAVVRVTDNDGKTDTAYIDINSNFTWHTHAVESTANAGYFGISMADLSGKPAIAYRNFTNASLDFARGTIAAPGSDTDWQKHGVNDPAQSVGAECSIAVLSGKACVSYYDGTDGALRYARATAAEPTSGSDWSMHVVDTVNDTGRHTSLAMLDGKPVIAYFDNTTYDIKLARATVATPSSSGDWAVHVVVSAGHEYSGYCSLVILDGKPALTYSNYSTGKVMFARATTAAPASSGDWSITEVDSIASDSDTALALIGGLPAVIYRDSYALQFARATTATPTGTSDWVTHGLDSSATAWTTLSMVELNGRPVVGYWDSTGEILRFLLAWTATPSSEADWLMQTVDSAGVVGAHAAMALINNQPYISYYDDTNDDLKFARPQ